MPPKIEPRPRTQSHPDAANRLSMARELLTVANELVAVVTEENAALKAQDYVKVDALYDRKEGLSRLYEQHIQALNVNRNMLKELPKAEQEKLRTVGEKMKIAGEENIRLLRGHMQATQTVIDAFTEAVRAENPDTAVTHVYSETGDSGRIKAPASTSSLLVNDTF